MGKYTHLSVTDRRRLRVFMEMGLPMTEIAKRLNRNRASLYRELKRNQEEEGYYFPVAAHNKANARTTQRRGRKIEKDAALREYILRGLQKDWSPEQISGRMKFQKLKYYASPETIYQYIYSLGSKELYQHLHYKNPKRRRRYARKERVCRFGKSRIITQRPAEIGLRKRFGHWEGDTIQFMGAREKVVTTLVERKSRIVYLIKNNSKHSRGVMDKIGTKIEALPEAMRRTITFDQGSEFADCRHLERKTKCKVYYCETHSPWQKGSNENMNGRLRRYLPASTEIVRTTQEELDGIALKMNQRPRKCLGFKTPNEVFIQQLKNDCRTWS